MTERENVLIAINHGVPEWVPSLWSAYQGVTSSLINNYGNRPGQNDIDMFGVKWMRTQDTGFQSIPSPYHHVFEDITKWEEFVRFPDIESWDWEAAAAKDTENLDRKNKIICMTLLEGNFNRLEALMGIENAMIAMYEEPEAVKDFFEAHTDFRIKLIKKVAQYYKPDIIINGDDVASHEGLFMSPAMYRSLCKPFEIKYAKAVIENGMICEHHVCGKVDEIIPDIVESGAQIWQTAQCMNDILGIKEKYGDKLCIHGGWDSTGVCSMTNATEEDIRAEVRRCIDTYAPGGNYILFPIIIGDPNDPYTAQRREWCRDEIEKYGRNFYKK